MIPLDDIRGQILANVSQYMGIPPSELTSALYGDICAAIMDVPGVASVGIHRDAATGTVDASVELHGGEVFTAAITEADCGVGDEEPLDDRIGHLVDGRIFDHQVAVQARFTKLEKTLSDRITSLATQVAELSSKLAFVDSAANLAFVTASNAQVTATEALVSGIKAAVMPPATHSIDGYPLPTFGIRLCNAIGKHTV